MTTAYDTFVSSARWRVALRALALTLLLGAALVIILAFGAADPPRAANLVLNLRSADDLAPAGTFDGARLFALPVELALPFTVELEASSSGDAASAWGIWLRVSDHYGNPRDLPMMVDQNGYVVAALTSPTFQHVQFIHLQPGSNRLVLHVDQDGTAVFRVNDEIFATIPLPVTVVRAVGLALDGDPTLDWKSIKIYTGN